MNLGGKIGNGVQEELEGRNGVGVIKMHYIYKQKPQTIKKSKDENIILKTLISSHCWRYHVHQKHGLEALELELIWLPPPRKLVFMVSEGPMQDSKGGKQPIVPPSYDAYELYQWPPWHHHPTCAVVALVPWLPVTNSFLIGLSCLTRVIPRLVLET